MYAVLVEYFDDEEGGKVAAVGPYRTNDDAIAARDRLEDDERYEYVRQVILVMPDDAAQTPAEQRWWRHDV